MSTGQGITAEPEVLAERAPRHGGAPTTEVFLSGGGEMGERMRAFDWSQTPLGPVHTWPQSLRSPLSMMLPSKASVMFFWGPEFVALYNDAYAPILGTKHPAVLGQPGRVAWSEIWDNQLRDLLEGVVRSGQAFHARDLQFTLERFGFVEETYFDVSYDPVRGESGEVEGVYCIVTETTGRVVGERRLALLTELAARTAPSRTPREACELAMQALTNRPGITFAIAWLGDEQQASTPDAEARLAAAPASLVRELPIAGGRLVVGLNPRRPFDEQYASFLDLVAGQLTTAITNAQALEEARRRAEALAEIDRAKTAFFSNVSHEFRTPLTLLLAPVAQLLEDTTVQRAPAERMALELIERNALRLHKLVNTLLDFSRIEAGRLQATFAPVKLDELTVDLASAFRSVVERAGLELRVECSPTSETAYVDREMWEKIVLNLLSNAFKHTFDGGITVRLTSDGGDAVLSVSDTGVGIPAGEVDHVFDRFYRVPSVRSRTHEGSGIGLSFVQELVRMHGGRITVRSTPGEGSTFEVRIPLGHAHLPADQVRHDPAGLLSTEEHRVIEPFVREASSWSGEELLPLGADAEAAPSQAILAEADVLVVDDNADMRAYMSRLLHAAGARVRLAENGDAALAELRRTPADVVLSDVMMPGLDGFGLLAAMRADDALRSTPFVMLSARAGEESRISGLAAGADDYLVKPFVARELIARVAAQVRLARVSAAERRARAEADEARREMSRVFEQAPVPICVIEGRELVYTSANAAYRQTIGGRDPVGQGVLQFWPELEGSELYQVLQQVLTTGQARSAREFKVRMDLNGTGELGDAFFNFVYHPLADANGAVNGIIAVAVDVTPQVQARQEAERLREAAESANTAKLNLLRTVSHETRQPVHASLGYLDMLHLGIRGELTDQQRRDLENIRRNQTHLLRLLNDILSFARLEAGAFSLDIEVADAAETMVQVQGMVEPQFRTRGVEYRMQPPATRATFRGDRERTVQVCVNLLTNALKATNRGGRVIFSCDVTDDRVQFTVHDTGVGIPREKFEHIFDPFTQLARAPSSEAGGVGLGLSISRQLARAMQGDVTVESTVGVGSTFTFSLPRAS